MKHVFVNMDVITTAAVEKVMVAVRHPARSALMIWACKMV